MTPRCSIRLTVWLALVSTFSLIAAVAGDAADERRPLRSGLSAIYRLDTLARFSTAVKVGSVSSYDRTGGNDDGFSGQYSFLRKEPGGLVIADLTGPGVIYRIWTPTPTDDVVEFYFDGETTPRLSVPFRELFTGTHPPFVSPIVGSGAGGFYSYLPIGFARSVKVLVRAEKVQFYQINYAIYPADAGIETIPAAPDRTWTDDVEKARALFSRPGADLSQDVAPPGAPIETRPIRAAVPAGRTVTVFESHTPGRIVGLRLGPSAAFTSRARDLVLRVWWDDDQTPAINCPVGDFFGYAWGRPAMRGLLAGTTEDENYLYLPMPWDRSARIELVSTRSGGPAVDVHGEVSVVNVGRREDEGRLYAVWHRENPTTDGRPFTFVDTTGAGHLVAVFLQAQGPEAGAVPRFFEGDDQALVDGEATVNGTGSEDFFNGGWYDVPGRWEDRVSLPLSGCLEFTRALGRTGGYRFFLGDAYSFRRSLRATIEHGPEGNHETADYTSVALLYAAAAPTDPGTPLRPETLRIADPDRVVFTPGWTMPIHAFSWTGASLTKREEQLGGRSVRFLSFTGEGADFFGPHYVSLIASVPAAGRYRVSIEAVAGPAQGIVQLTSNESPAGEPVDFYASTRTLGPAAALGTLDLTEGTNHVMLKMVGKNQQSSGLGLDLYRVICDRLRP